MLKLRNALILTTFLVLIAAGCGDDDSSSDDDSSTTTAASSDSASSGDDAKGHEEASAEELEVWQTDLNAVGCYVGAVDGSLGPQTEAAIEAYQAAKGLTVDGLLGPETEGALQEDVAAGEIVCVQPEDGETDESAPSGASAQVSSESFGPVDFTLGSCTNGGETDLVAEGSAANNETLQINAPDGTGTMSITGGTEEDGIDLAGDVTSVTVGDAGDFTVDGAFTGDNLAGEAFTITGSCAGA